MVCLPNSLEADGLYRPMNFTSFTSSVPSGTAPSNTVVTWEIPLLLKWRFTTGRLRPFIEGGGSFRVAGNLNDSSPSHYGASAGAGLELKAGRSAISATARYTRWAADSVLVPRTNQNQVEILLGWSFPGPKLR